MKPQAINTMINNIASYATISQEAQIRQTLQIESIKETRHTKKARRGFFYYIVFCLVFGVFVSTTSTLEAMSYQACQNFYKQATTSIDSTRVFSIIYNGKPHLLAYSKTPLKSSKIIKKDRFLGLYLFSGSTPLSYKIKPLDSYAHTLPLAGVSQSEAINGSITNFEKGIFDLGRFSKPLPKDSVISNICFQIYGFYAYGNYFVPKILIDRFLSNKGGIYGDIGVRIIEVAKDSQNLVQKNPANPTSAPKSSPAKKSIVVEQIDIFFPNNPFLPNDIITSINGEKITSSVDFEWRVANLSPNSSAKIGIIRAGQPRTLEVKVGNRYGGGLISDTFLERFGVWLDENLVIRAMQNPLPFNLSLLSEGDQLLWIDKVPIKRGDGFWHLKELLMRAWLNGNIELLILHEGVEAFVRSQMR